MLNESYHRILMKPAYVVLGLLFLGITGFEHPLCAAAGDENWDSNFAPPAGLNGEANCAVHLGGNLYVGGAFSKAGGLDAPGIARWDGRNWFPVGQGVRGGVWALAVKGGELYVGGSFVTIGSVSATNIAKWTGHEWQNLGSGIRTENPGQNLPQSVYALASDGSD